MRIKLYTAVRHVYLPVILLCLASIFILPKLGQTPLRSWDEAWYAEIARNILNSGNWLLMKWNGLPYYDHPPFGFWLMALSFKLFGVSEFAARLPSALSGITSIILIYFIGKNLFNKTVGFAAGIILLSTPWFWLRSREGNLDIILVCFSLLSILFAYKSKKEHSFLPILALVFSFVLLTKTVIGLGLIPIILYLYMKPVDLKPSIVILSVLILLTVFIPWYLINFISYGLPFIDRNIFVTGLRLASWKAIGHSEVGFKIYPATNLYNLHMGILLWYKPLIVSLIGSVIFIKLKSFRAVLLWLMIYLGLFFTSPKTQLWHFIIVYPAIALLISAFIYSMFEKALKIATRITGKPYFTIILPITLFVLTLSAVFFVAVKNVKDLYKDIVRSNPINDEIILAKSVLHNESIVYIDDDYWPTAIFYSERNIINVNFSANPELRTVGGVFKNSSKPFFLLTKQWILDRDKISVSDYEIIKQVGERVLVKSL